MWFQNKRSKERRMKQMTSMVGGRAFFPGKGGRRGFPMIGDDFGYFPHDKPFHDFGGYPNFPPPPDGFFPPGPMGFPMGPGGPPPPPGGPNIDQPLPMHGPPPPPLSGGMGEPPFNPPPPGQPGQNGDNSNSSSSSNNATNPPAGSGPAAPQPAAGNSGSTAEGGDFTLTDLPPSRPSPDFQSSSGGTNSF